MVAPLIAAAARAAAKAAAKSAAKKSAAKSAAKGTAKTPRPKRASDELYNARRRYKRQAERQRNIAETEVGAARERRLSLAKQLESKAEELYVKAPTSEARAEKLITESKGVLESSLDDPLKRREMESELILKSKIGKRIYAGTVDVWKPGDDYKTRLDKIMQHFGVDNYTELLTKIEKMTDGDIYADPEKIERYDEVVTAIRRAMIRQG